MSEQATGEAPAVLTPRLVFDDTEIPAFLRKDRQVSHVEPKEEETSEVIEPETPTAVVEPADESFELPEESTALVEAPAEQVEEVEGQDNEQLAHDGDSSSNLDDMSVEDLQRQQQEIDRKIQEKREAEKRSVIEQIVSVVNTYKIPIEELVEALGGLKVKRKGVKAKPKYQDPTTGAIWSGRGKEPAWIKGKKRDPFLIK